MTITFLYLADKLSEKFIELISYRLRCNRFSVFLMVACPSVTFKPNKHDKQTNLVAPGNKNTIAPTPSALKKNLSKS